MSLSTANLRKVLIEMEFDDSRIIRDPYWREPEPLPRFDPLAELAKSAIAVFVGMIILALLFG